MVVLSASLSNLVSLGKVGRGWRLPSGVSTADPYAVSSLCNTLGSEGWEFLCAVDFDDR